MTKYEILFSFVKGEKRTTRRKRKRIWKIDDDGIIALLPKEKSHRFKRQIPI